MAALAVLMVVQSASAQGKLEGVWRIAEVIRGGQNPIKLTVDATHPGLFIVTRKHWCLINLTNPNRPDLPQQGATDAQKVATWTPVVAFAGTYEMKGNITTFRTIVAKDPSDMPKDGISTNEFKFEGSSVIWTPKTNANGPIADPIITKFVRVE
jgi:hypothetical protein